MRIYRNHTDDYRASCDRALADLIASRRALGLTEDPYAVTFEVPPLALLAMREQMQQDERRPS